MLQCEETLCYQIVRAKTLCLVTVEAYPCDPISSMIVKIPNIIDLNISSNLVFISLVKSNSSICNFIESTSIPQILICYIIQILVSIIDVNIN